MTPTTPTHDETADGPLDPALLSPDTGRIRFSVRTRPMKYGDGETFFGFRIVMRSNGKAVGIEDGPRRLHKTRGECRIAGWDRIRVLKTHVLFIVPVSKKDIDDGQARSCHSCAIAQALWRNQERIGLEKWKFDFRVEPYGFSVDCDGITLENTQRFSDPPIATGQDAMPDLVSEGSRGLYVESMYEWALNWDDWAESRDMSEEEWLEEHPDDGGKPYRPVPCSFVLDLSEMTHD